MKLTTNQILALLQLKDLGKAKLFRLLKLLNKSITDTEELKAFVRENSSFIKLPEYSDFDFQKAFDKAEQIISKSEELNIKIVSYYDKYFPLQLKDIDNPPMLLHIKGDINKFNDYINVAIIGTRQPSEYGSKIGERLGYLFGEAGFNVISGLAIGCDTTAHSGCINAGGITTAVLAHGLDSIYPKENKKLAFDILNTGGFWVSEYAVGTKSFANYFVERDRIQAGLSSGVVVVETGIKGGTMHTVRFATNGKRLLAAYDHPQNKQTEKSQGNQQLIKNKIAIGLSSSDDIQSLIHKLKQVNEL